MLTKGFKILFSSLRTGNIYSLPYISVYIQIFKCICRPLWKYVRYLQTIRAETLLSLPADGFRSRTRNKSAGTRHLPRRLFRLLRLRKTASNGGPIRRSEQSRLLPAPLRNAVRRWTSWTWSYGWKEFEPDNRSRRGPRQSVCLFPRRLVLVFPASFAPSPAPTADVSCHSKGIIL